MNRGVALLIVVSLLAPCARSSAATPPGATAAKTSRQTAETSAPKAELVSVTTDDHVPLFGLLYTPTRPTGYAVIHIPGGPGAFYSAQDMAPLASELNRDDYAFLSINMRTAGSMLRARFEDYLLDVGAAVRLARQRGFTHLVLLGHSLGSARVVYYMARTKDPTVEGLVLSGVITSPYLEAQMRWNEAERARYDLFLQKQRERIQAGHGGELASYPWSGGRELEMSADTWVSVFGAPQESNASTVKFAADIRVPVLVVHGTKDEAAMPENAQELLKALVASPAKQLVMVEGANHLFMGYAQQYADIVANWVRKTVPQDSTTGR